MPRRFWYRLQLFTTCFLVACSFLFICRSWSRKDSCEKCNEHEFRPILKPSKDFCHHENEKKKNDKNLLLILVHSRQSSFEKRNAIRQTWASPAKRKEHAFRVLFVFGVLPSQHQQRLLQQQQQQRQEQQHEQHEQLRDLQVALMAESHQFGDILQTDFIDTYSNVTLKALSGLDFATRTVFQPDGPTSGNKRSNEDHVCGNAFDYVAKVDDDVFLNIDNLARYLGERRQRHRIYSNRRLDTDKLRPSYDTNDELFIGGQCDWHMPRRVPGDKWFVGPLEYPHISYPMYCHGFTILYSMEAAKRIYWASRDVPFFRFDDVYLTGLIATRHLGLNVINIHGIYIYGGPEDICFRKKVMLSEHGEGGKQLVDDWNKVLNANCH